MNPTDGPPITLVPNSAREPLMGDRTVVLELAKRRSHAHIVGGDRRKMLGKGTVRGLSGRRLVFFSGGGGTCPAGA